MTVDVNDVIARLKKWAPALALLDEIFAGDTKAALAELRRLRKARRAARDKRMGRAQ